MCFFKWPYNIYRLTKDPHIGQLNGNMIHMEILDVFGTHGRFYYTRLFSSLEGLGPCLLRAKTEFSKFFKLSYEAFLQFL